MTLSSEHSEFKICPNCHGEGTEANPPMRKCGVCKGTGKIADQGNRFVWDVGDRVLITDTNGVTRESDTGRVVKKKKK